MTRQTLVSSLAILVLGAWGVACKSGGVGDPCIPNLEYAAADPGASETGAQIEDRSFQCETRICLINHFRGRVSCPWGNEKGTLVPGQKCLVPGTTVEVTAAVQSQCKSRKDNVYCSCRCAGEDSAAKYCECPSGYQCATVTNILSTGSGSDEGLRPGDKYCVLPGNDYTQDSKKCDTTDDCHTAADKCGYSENRQEF